MLLTDVILIPLSLMLRGRWSDLYQHLFRFFGHPEVYFNFTWFWNSSVIIQTLQINKSLAFRYGICDVSIGILGFIVWAHHMYTVGLDVDTCLFHSATMITAVLQALRSLVVGHIIRAYLRLKTPILFVLGFLLLFTLGGLSGVVGQLRLRCAFHDTIML
jgi:heme/copper-type cytochrome/quinol oxidase subunit 1